MLKLLKAWSWPPRPPVLRRTLDFTRPRDDHWASYDGGDNYDAYFTIRGAVAHGDTIVVAMQSGRAGCYKLFSVRPDFMGEGDWKAQGIRTGYWSEVPLVPKLDTTSHPKIKGLLGDGTRWIRSNSGELAHLPSGFTKPASDFWKVLCRDEARRGWADSIRATGNL